MKEKLEKLLQQIKERKGGADSSKSHLKSALYDWRIEDNWSRNNCFVISENDLGFAFYTFTIREPRHCTLRHIFTLEEARGQGIGKKLMNRIEEHMKRDRVEIMRFYANKPAIKFYEKLGYTWLGENKQGLPFTYCDICTKKNINNQQQLKKIFKIYNQNNLFNI